MSEFEMGVGRIVNRFAKYEHRGIAIAILLVALYDMRCPSTLSAGDARALGYSSLQDELDAFWESEWADWLCEWFGLDKEKLLRLMDQEDFGEEWGGEGAIWL